MRQLKLIAPLMGLAFAGCAGEGGSEGRGVTVAVAPLTLPGVSDVCYTLEVQNDVGQSVWSEEHVCSSQYGNSVGAITYIGPCDALDNAPTDGSAKNTVTLTIENIYTSDVDPDNYTLGAIADDEWDNPCGRYRPGSQYGSDVAQNADGFGPCQLSFECIENADVEVEFNVTIMRDANQGFFDIAVNFEDVFCSAKFDSCYGEDAGADPIELLFDAEGERAWTSVFGFACTAGPGADIDTHLMFSRIQIVCDDVVRAEIDPTQQAGNNSVTLTSGQEIGYGIYRGEEQLQCPPGGSCNKLYWNLAFNLEDIEALDGSCTINFSATVDDAGDGFAQGLPVTTGLVYPYLDVVAPVTHDGAAFSQQNGLNECDPMPVGGTEAMCQDAWEQWNKFAEAVGVGGSDGSTLTYPETYEEFIAASPCDLSCIEGYARYLQTTLAPGVTHDDMATWTAANCETCVVATGYYGDVPGSEPPQMCWEFDGEDAGTTQNPFPLEYQAAAVASPTECAGFTALTSSAVLSLAEPGPQRVALGDAAAIGAAGCLPEGELLLGSIEESMKAAESDDDLGGTLIWGAKQVYGEVEQGLKWLEAFPESLNRRVLASVETYLKYDEAVGSSTFGCFSTDVLASVETYLKYAEAVGLTGEGVARTRAVCGSNETYLKYYEAVGLSSTSKKTLAARIVVASVETYMKYVEATSLDSIATVPAGISRTVIASAETYSKYAEGIASGAATVLTASDLLALATAVTPSGEDAAALQGLLASKTPTIEGADLAAVIGYYQSQVAQCLAAGGSWLGVPGCRSELLTSLDIGIVLDNAGLDELAAAGREFGGSPIFDKGLICDNYALGLLASNVAGGLSLDRIADKGFVADPEVDLAQLLGAHPEAIDLVLDKGIVADGFTSVAVAFEYADTIALPSDTVTFNDKLGQLLDRGAFDAQSTTPGDFDRSRSNKERGLSGLGVGGGVGSNTVYGSIGIVAVRDLQPAWDKILSLGLDAGQWQTVLPRGLVLWTDDAGIIQLSNIEDYVTRIQLN